MVNINERYSTDIVAVIIYYSSRAIIEIMTKGKGKRSKKVKFIWNGELWMNKQQYFI